jgi:hypothetical protein
VILLYPLVVVAAVVVWLRRDGVRPRGWRWFAAWAAAGALMSFSFVTGLSIGVLVLPFAAVLLLWTARTGAGPAEALGVLVGIGATLLVVALLNRGSTGVDPRPWLVAGVLAAGSSLVVYALARRPGK